MKFALLYAVLRHVIGFVHPSADRELKNEAVVFRHQVKAKKRGGQLKSSFAMVWSRIEAHLRETFGQIRRGEFTYQVVSGGVAPRTERIV